MPDDPDDTGRKMATVIVAALLFATDSDRTDATLNRSFEAAERFVAEAERRYGNLDA